MWVSLSVANQPVSERLISASKMNFQTEGHVRALALVFLLTRFLEYFLVASFCLFFHHVMF